MSQLQNSLPPQNRPFGGLCLRRPVRFAHLLRIPKVPRTFSMFPQPTFSSMSSPRRPVGFANLVCRFAFAHLLLHCPVRYSLTCFCTAQFAIRSPAFALPSSLFAHLLLHCPVRYSLTCFCTAQFAIRSPAFALPSSLFAHLLLHCPVRYSL